MQPLEATTAAIAPALEAPAQAAPQLAPTTRRKRRANWGIIRHGSTELRDLKDRFLAWMAVTQYAEESMKGAHSDMEWFLGYLDLMEITRIADVTREVLDDYSLWLRAAKNRKHEGRALSVAHIHHRLSGVKHFFAWLARQMLILVDPAEDLELPRLHYGLPSVILTQEEARKLLDAPDLSTPVGYRDKVLMETVYATGIRSGEMIRLKVEHIDLKARTLFVKEGKGAKNRLIPLPTLTVAYLKEYIEKVRPRFIERTDRRRKDEGILFVSWRGKAFDRTRLGEIFKRATKAAGVEKPVTCMVLRHSIASHLLENGMDCRYIQEFLGHEHLSTTQIYAKVTLSGLRKHYNKHHPKERRANRQKAAPSEKTETQW